ncbi:hypothetical protein BV22DRAFT_115902 [Leucogyrophana mollusca]|uniref:Uncharacterized protein n=1 Tax=Leucogyrophana mollusca TaxID=85980 RepID=A0ACB8BVD4_9AGAM|nr:hypothetical protein BV22DRAFT_115902 [Leucogyrophana mollusca]
MSINFDPTTYSPGLVGFTMSLGMYGVALGQYCYYCRAFPRDKRLLKCLVLLTFALDSLHTYACAASEWWILVKCRGDRSSSCAHPPWQFCIPFVAQGFYSHRVWIISNRNVLITVALVLMTITQLVLGLLSVVLLVHDIMSIGTAPYATVALVLSVPCDALISGTVFFYLRPGRAGVKRTETRIQNITNIFVNMGFLTCITSIATIALYFSNRGSYIATLAPAAAKSYVNSVLAVLNARKPAGAIKPMSTFELPTIRITNANEGGDSDSSQIQSARLHESVVS